MNALAKSNKAAIEPRLWIRRIALFEAPDKRNSPIREILFHRGLNIVWGVELPDSAGTNDAHPVTLSGHSVGKTTLCRLIRYCLGELTYGNPGAMLRIKNAFPYGWVGMELTVDGKEWSVLKPIGTSGDSKAAKAVAIESLFDLKRKDNEYSVFMPNLQTAMMSGFKASSPPNSDKPFEWKHLIAWLTRDQEARFQSLHDWRSARSGSEHLKFDKPKEHALYLIRLVLDLMQEIEVDASRKLSDSERELNQLDVQMAELRREPQYRFNEQERLLKQVLGMPSGQTLNVDISDWTSPLFLRRKELSDSISAIELEIEKINFKITHKRIWLVSYDEKRKLFRDAMEVTDQATEHQVEDGEPEDVTIQKLREIRGKECEYGNVPFNQCSYVESNLGKLEKIGDLQKKREERRATVETEQRETVINQQRKVHDEVIVLLNELQKKLSSDLAKKRDKEEELMKIRAQKERLLFHLDQREKALDMIEGRTTNTELQRVTTLAADIKAKIELQTQKVVELQESYGNRLKSIRKVYDGIVKSALSSTYSGMLHMPNGELEFRIKEETGLSGEAVETLALVLADVAAMVSSCRGIGYHPRFLLHDSPREADLDRHIYNRYLQAMWRLTTESGGKEEAPFQYIVTTTSRPPKELKTAICLRLEAHPEKNMLFRRLLKNPEVKNADLFEGKEGGA